MTIKTINTKTITPQMWGAFSKNWRTTIDKTNLPDNFMTPILALLEAAPEVSDHESFKLGIKTVIQRLAETAEDLDEKKSPHGHVLWEQVRFFKNYIQE